MELSVGATVAWQMAGAEAINAKHQYIEKEHIFMGICGLEKVVLPKALVDIANLGVAKVQLNPQEWQALKAEYHKLGCILNNLKLNEATLRQEVRKGLPEGSYVHNDKDPIHRSDECKRVFARAEVLAGDGKEITSLHLLVAILENPGDTISSVLVEAGVSLKGLQERAFACLNGEYRGTSPTSLYGIILSKVSQISSGYGKELKTRAGKFEIILGAIYCLSFISYFILGLILPKDAIHEYVDRIHKASIVSFIPLLISAEVYYVIRGLWKEETSKLVKHAVVSLFLFFCLIILNHLAYKWFISLD